ncbi:Na(+)-translocating NADH-quinone reductase subunit F [Flavobacterium chuncheonense]|uniref:Na(+)-translocating NADH-quinone reductase subunit F n=1 Tax=Flavobacterium chuncheonense TaxID=2026653 RepID=A0ABW5YJG3_9FLAO
MKTTERFDLAIKKLYTAFHNNTLNPECCKYCAVGNILDNNDFWKFFSDAHGSVQLNYLGLVIQNLGRRFNGYTPAELLQIEATFLEACGYKLPLRQLYHKKAIDKNKLFDGLESVLTLLCKLDHIDNIMDCYTIFNFEKESIVLPKKPRS